MVTYVLIAIGVFGTLTVAEVVGYVFAVDTLRNAPETFTAIVAIGVLAVALELLWARARGRGPTEAPPPAEAEPVVREPRNRIKEEAR